MPERTLMGIVARTAYWVEWWRRFGPPSGSDPKLDDPFGRYVLTTFVKGTNMGPYEVAKHIPGVSGHELSYVANRHFVLPNEAVADLVNAHARLDISQAWGDGTAGFLRFLGARDCSPNTLIAAPVLRGEGDVDRLAVLAEGADVLAAGTLVAHRVRERVQDPPVLGRRGAPASRPGRTSPTGPGLSARTAAPPRSCRDVRTPSRSARTARRTRRSSPLPW
nr:transposase [Streptomyces sp. NBC_00830]WTB35673.1 transposase [Streptomyces sp. NBC_00830]